MQAVQGFVGYNPRPLLFAVYVLLAILTGGLLWVIGQLFPRSLLWTMAKCPLSHAQYVQAQVQLRSCKSLGRRCLMLLIQVLFCSY